MNAVSGFRAGLPIASCSTNSHGPDSVPDEFGSGCGRSHDSGPDAVYDEYVPSRCDNTYSSYDSWSSYDSGSTTYGALF